MAIRQKIKEDASKNNLNISDAEIINPKTSDKFEEYANSLYELRKAKGMTLEQAKKITIRTNLFWNDDGKKQRC